MSRGLTAACFALAVACSGPQALAEPRAIGAGGVWLGALGGYAIPFDFASQANQEVDETQFGAAIAQIGVGLTDSVAPGRFYDGSLSLVGELPFLIESQPHSGFAWGGTLLLRWSFLAAERMLPFFEIGAGILDLDFDVLGRSDGLNFTFQGGGGLEWPVSERIALTALFRYHHISNGGIESRNVAVDSALFLAGISFRPGWRAW